MFEIVEAIHKVLKTESTAVFVLVISGLFAAGGGAVAWIVDQGYKNSAEYRDDHKQLAGPLKEWQQVLILTAISQYPGHKVLILSGVGDETAAYANQFRDLFQKAKWIVDGPKPAPIDQVVFDVQFSIDPYIFTHPEVQPILSAFDSARIRHRPGTHDPNIPTDWVVLWVGARPPEGEPQHIPLQVPPGTLGDRK
jgi:hypothetical protein